MDEVMHTCPYCRANKISEKAIEYCDQCRGENGITRHQMILGERVYTASPSLNGGVMSWPCAGKE